MDIPILLSGNFGELRGSHFHGGIDIKTQGVEGKPVFSVEDGYVSRIKVMPNGYGNVLYITHPRLGLSTVYGHLLSFSGEIAGFVEDLQYKEESFAVEAFPLPSQLPLRKGDLIGLSGNSGSSGGPHLHFEIRNAKTENTLNPLLFKWDIQDNVKPKVKTISIYSLSKESYVDNKTQNLHLEVSGSQGDYRINRTLPIEVWGEIGFGIDVVDYLSGSSNECGIYTVELFVDHSRVFYSVVDDLSFAHSRSILSHIDFAERARSGRDIQKSFVDPGNRLSFYKELKNAGVNTFRDNLIHSILYKISDVHGNQSVIKFEVMAIEPDKPPTTEKKSPPLKVFPYNEANVFQTDEIKLVIPEGALFNDLVFRYELQERIPKTFSALHHLKNTDVPLNNYVSISIKAIGLPPKLQSKALLVQVSGSPGNYRLSSAGGSFRDGVVSGKTRNFGKYAIGVDTVPPSIKPLNISDKKNLTGQKSIRFNISDNLSGIQSFKGMIDGNWVLFKYDEKNKLIWFDLEEKRITKGKDHRIKMEVRDNKSNIKNWEASFFW